MSVQDHRDATDHHVTNLISGEGLEDGLEQRHGATIGAV